MFSMTVMKKYQNVIINMETQNIEKPAIICKFMQIYTYLCITFKKSETKCNICEKYFKAYKRIIDNKEWKFYFKNSNYKENISIFTRNCQGVIESICFS